MADPRALEHLYDEGGPLCRYSLTDVRETKSKRAAIDHFHSSSSLRNDPDVTMAVVRSAQVFQFRLFLEGTQPLVWRRFRVANDLTLARLHRVIQAVMDWQDYHLHEFSYAGRVYGVPDPDYADEREVVEDRAVRLRDVNLSVGDRFEYVYDLGDNWQHVLQLEEALPADADDIEPLCLAGERSAPPEDVGGTSGYEEFLEALLDPNHEEHDQVKNWLGRPFDPERFSVDEANQRLKKVFRRRKIGQKRK